MTAPTPPRRTPRSYLYVPGDRPRMLAKALDRGADALIVDLEDAVAPAAKQTALRAVRRWLEELAPDNGADIWVRVNPGPDGLREAAALVGPALRGLCLAKCPDPGVVSAFHDVLTEREAHLGLTAGGIALSPLLETAAAVLNAPALAAAPRVAHLQAGEADLCAELGMEPRSDDRSELLVVRTTLVLACAAAGIAPPVGPVSTVFRDTGALLASTRALRRLGYRSRACIHPDQLPVVHEVFTPSAEEVAAARALVDRFEEAARSGRAVVTGADGRMVDEAVVRAARRVLGTAPEQGT
ncbi:HpcH/HpaI aldolase/citrate lyase family protein [Streptomyces sp. NBC_00728]|uniref:HpcH/HpaI aldolase/citrate lyase family protein n=1 Tax=Streptomyces sp. NBC_00728 TaxID=2903676 RepID=UPI0038687009